MQTRNTSLTLAMSCEKGRCLPKMCRLLNSLRSNNWNVSLKYHVSNRGSKLISSQTQIYKATSSECVHVASSRLYNRFWQNCTKTCVLTAVSSSDKPTSAAISISVVSSGCLVTFVKFSSSTLIWSSASCIPSTSEAMSSLTVDCQCFPLKFADSGCNGQ